MTDTTISTTTTSGQTVRSTDRLFIASNGNLKPSGTAVTWSLTTSSSSTALIDNSGIIQSTGGRAFDSSGSASGAQSLNIVNRAGAQISASTDIMREQSNLGGGTLSVDNSGSITTANGRGFNLQEYQGTNFSFTNRVGGTLQTTNDALRVTTASAGAVTANNVAFTGTITIDNSGTIKTVGAGSGQALDFNDVNATSLGHVSLTNRAGGIVEAADADAIRGARFMTIDNYGTIQSKNANSASTGNDGIDFQANNGGVVNNYQGGSVIGARHGITGDNPVTISNDGAITGQLGAGINLDTQSTSTTVITNTVHGVITGNAAGSTDGDGIDVDGLATITNSGTIQALGHATSFAAPDTAPPTNEAITIGGGSITNNAGGLIHSVERAITVDDSNGGNAFASTTIVNHGTITGDNGTAIVITDNFGDTITNDGTINGSVTTGSAGDTITNSGTINGALSTGAGNDTVNWNSLFTGTVDGGSGTDRLVLNGTFDATSGSAHFTGFETISGTLTGVGAGAVLDLSASTATGSLTINGSDGGNIIKGGAENDTITGGSGDDTLSGGSGTDSIDGGAGNDTLILAGNHDAYTVSRVGTAVSISGTDITDSVANVESFQFADGTFTVGQMGNVGPALTGAQATLAHGTEDSAYTLHASDLLAGFTDANGDALSVVLGATPAHIAVTDNHDGTYTLTPTADFNGPVTLSYNVTDDNGGSTAASVSVSFDAVNDAPVLTGQQAVLAHGTEDTPYIVSASDLLASFTDVDGDTLSVANLSASSGTLTDNHDGTYTVVQAANANGPVTLTYTVVDGNGGVAAASLGYTVDAVNDAPALTGQQAVLAHGTENAPYAVSATDLLTGFTDVDGDTLSVANLSASSGTLTDNHDGTYTIVPDAHANGPVTLTYTVIDGNGGVTAASLGYTIDGVNDAPALTGTPATLAGGTEDTSYVVHAADLLTGYTDVDGDTLAVSGLAANHGTVTDNHDGTYTLAPAANFNGTMTLTYAVVDGHGGSIAASNSFAVAAVNDAPSALSLSHDTVAENSANGTAVGTLTATDVDDTAFTYTLLDSAGGRFAVDAHTGALTVAKGNLLDYETAQHYTIDAQVKDAAGATYHQQFTINLSNVVENQSYKGTGHADIFTATSDDNWTVNSLGGDDVITTLGGNDTIIAGPGADRISTGAGDDTILIGKGAGIDIIDGGAGNDSIIATAANTVIGLAAISGIETISSGGFAGVKIVGTTSSDVLDFSGMHMIGIQSIEGGNGNDVLTGSLDDDRIMGGNGTDTLAGGGGDDIFVYTAIAQSGIGIKADHILDFGAGDRIDLSAIDANSKVTGHQAFTFIGTAAFTGLGQLRIGDDGHGHVSLLGNTTGNNAADFQIIFDNNPTIHASDLIL